MWGKLLGAIFGYLLTGNLIGAFVGLLIGNFFDRGLRGPWQVASWLNTNNEHQLHTRQVFFRVTFQVMGHVAKADGQVSEDEIRMARSVMQRMRLTEQQKHEAIRLFSEGKAPDFNLAHALHELATACSAQHLLLKMFVEVQYQAALAGGIAPEQQAILNVISRRLGFAPFFSQDQTGGWSAGGSSSQRQRSSRSTTSLSDAYAMLNITAEANNREIKRAYRKQMSQHHPDKLIAQGLPEEMIKLATDKSQKIQAAYEKIRTTRGF